MYISYIPPPKQQNDVAGHPFPRIFFVVPVPCPPVTVSGLASDTMFCVLLGFTNNDDNDDVDDASRRMRQEVLWNSLVRDVTCVTDDDHEDDDDDDVDQTPIAIAWVESTTAVDPDTGALTWVVSAWTAADPDALCGVVQRYLRQRQDHGDMTAVEVWASAPAPLPLKPTRHGGEYPIHEQQHDDIEAEAAHSVLREWGLWVQRSVLDADQLRELRGTVHDAIQRVEALLRENRPHLRIGQDDFLFHEIASRNRQRFDLRLNHRDAVVAFVQTHIVGRAAVSDLLRSTLGGDDYTFDVSVVYSKPGACAQHWHADGAHQRGARDAGFEARGWRTRLADPHALCLFVPLVDLDETIGGTQFWPGSHRYRDLAGFGPVATLVGATYETTSAAAGDGLWYDYRLLHRGLPNTSETTLRPILQVMFSKPWYVERANFGTESIVLQTHNGEKRTDTS